MDSWDHVLERMRAHTPRTPKQVREEIAAAERTSEEARRLAYPRLHRFHAWTAVGVLLIIAGVVMPFAGVVLPFVSGLWAWVVTGVGIVVFAVSFGGAKIVEGEIDIAGARVQGVKYDHHLISPQEAAEIADLSERSPEFAKIVNSWLEVCGTLTLQESIRVRNAKEAFERHTAEQRIRSSSNGVEPTDKAA